MMEIDMFYFELVGELRFGTGRNGNSHERIARLQKQDIEMKAVACPRPQSKSGLFKYAL